jgi:rhodanese-related sulfurtransferase
LLLTLACAEHVARKDLLAQIEAGSAPPIVDVRTLGEYTTSHVPGAVQIPFYALLMERERIPAPQRPDQPLVLYCEHGPRAGMARVQLWLAGVKPVVFLEGHMIAWKRDGLPVETGPGPQPADGAATLR